MIRRILRVRANFVFVAEIDKRRQERSNLTFPQQDSRRRLIFATMRVLTRVLNTYLFHLAASRSLRREMRVLRQFGVLVLLLVSCLAPAMACMVPNAEMSAQERACCRVMKNQCGQMEMPASQGCCQKTPPSVHDNALDTKAAAFHPVVVSVIWLTASELLNPASVVTGWVERPDHSPPKSPPATISILRI
jgi:hypothetical protein